MDSLESHSAYVLDEKGCLRSRYSLKKGEAIDNSGKKQIPATKTCFYVKATAMGLNTYGRHVYLWPGGGDQCP